MGNHTHFDLQLFAEGDTNDLASILGQIEETPRGYDDEASEADTPTEESAAPEEEYDEFTYNKQTVKTPKSERTTLLQKGYNYDKVQGKLSAAEEKMAAIDAWVKATYGEHGINNWDEWQRQLAIQRRQEQLEEMGIDEDSYKHLLENDPELNRLRQEAEALRKDAEEKAISQRLDHEVQALNEAYGLNLETIDDIVRLPNAERIIEIARKSGLPLTDCYLLANKEELMAKQAKAGAQKVRNQVASKAHVKDTAKASDAISLVQVPADVYAMYRQLNPKATEREIREHYAKSRE